MNIFKTKKAISIFCVVCTLGVGISVAAISSVIVQAKSHENLYYQFDGQKFSSNEELMEYVKNNITTKAYKNQYDYFLYNKNTYDVKNSYSAITKDMLSSTPIVQYQTYRNPYDYLIDSSNQVSNQVLTGKNDVLKTVYQGKDNNAYLDKTAAIKSYEDYKKVYKLGNIIDDSSDSVEFNNKFEVTQYLENVIGKNLTDKNTTTCYQMAGTCLTKDQIKDWIKSTSDTEYDYNGYRWSKIGKVDNISDMQLLQKDENENIIKYKPAKNAYWLNYDSKGLIGTFSGTQYLETDFAPDALMNKLRNEGDDGWKKVSSDSMNLLLSKLVIVSSMINYILNQQTSVEDKSWNIETDFFDPESNDEKSFEDKFKLANDWLYKKAQGLNYENLSIKLNSISGMSKWNKSLVFAQAVYNYTLTCNHSGNESAALDLLDFLKELIRNLIVKNSGMFTDQINAIFDRTKPTLVESEDVLSLTDIIHLFLNPSKFLYESPSKANGLTDIIESIQKMGDTIFDNWNKIAELFKQGGDVKDKAIKLALTSYETFLVDGETKYLINGQMVDANTAYKKIEKYIKQNLTFSADGSSAELAENVKPVGDVASFATKFIAGFQLAKSIWDLGNTLSFLSFTTYENDFGNGQKITYRTTEAKLPIFNTPLWNEKFEDRINAIKVIDNTTTTSDASQTDDMWIVLGSLFNGKEAAQKYLKEYIVAHPTDFVSTRAYYINVMGTNEHEELPINKEEPFDAIRKMDEFIEYIFDKYFLTNTIQLYFDGINEFFESPIDAKQSMETKITNNEFVIKYKLIDNEGIVKYFDSAQDAIDADDNYIENNILQSKVILSSDLIKTIRYDDLKEQLGVKNSVYGVLFNGLQHYFITYADALYYVYRNSDVTFHSDTIVSYYVYFHNHIFNSESDFYKWVKENTITVNSKGEEVVN